MDEIKKFIEKQCSSFGYCYFIQEGSYREHGKIFYRLRYEVRHTGDYNTESYTYRKIIPWLTEDEFVAAFWEYIHTPGKDTYKGRRLREIILQESI